MKNIAIALALSLTVMPALAQKSCDELKSEITAKLEAKGLKGFQLEVVSAADVKDQQVVGSCEGGKKKVTYKKG